MVKKIVFLSVFILFATPLHIMALNFNPGKYQITTSIEMSGMPAGMPGAMPAQTITQCMTEKDFIPKDTSGSGGNCNVINVKTSGNTVTFSLECNQDGVAVKSKGKMIYSGNTFEGSTETSMGPSSGGMVLKTVIKGKRIGSCD